MTEFGETYNLYFIHFMQICSNTYNKFKQKDYVSS